LNKPTRIWVILVALIVIGIFVVALLNILQKSKKPLQELQEHKIGNATIGVGGGGIRIVVLVDNNPYRSGLETAWGLSVYVDAWRAKFLFDTGPDPNVLICNAEKLGVDLSEIEFVVISHVHGDHTGGLELIASLKPKLKIYIPPDRGLIGYMKSLGLKPIIVNSTIEIANGIYVVKPLYGPPMEEAVAIKTDRGLIVLVGCSHPGVVNMVRQAVRDIGVKPYMVIGGFHMSGANMDEVREVVDELVEMGVERICPIHCSGDTIRQYLAKYYSDKYIDGGVGLKINIQP
jgi:7,8-dihydropterin-6-yl-methyl-4-(beta-D-ribofuranosyl)aminobenzene 5'-phosphate synthase